MQKKIKLLLLTTVLVFVFNINVYAADTENGIYTVDIRYDPLYLLDGSNELHYLATHYVGNIPFEETYQKSTTYTIQGKSSVNLFTIIDKYDMHKVTLQCRVDQDSDLWMFKVQSMYIIYEWIPNHIQPEVQFQGSLVNHVANGWLENGYVEVFFQGKSRHDDKWYDLSTFQLKKGENYPFYYYDAEDGINYSAYRFYLKYYNIKNNGLTLANTGDGGLTLDICSCDFYFTADDFDQKMNQQLSDLKNLQDNTLLEVKGIGDLVKAIPQTILDGIYNLFVPDDLNNTMNGYIQELLDSMGILGFPFELAYYQINAISSYSPHPVIEIPELQFQNYYISSGYTFNLSSIGDVYISALDMSLISIVRMCTSLLLIYSIANMSKSILCDLGILKSNYEDLGGGNI